jgi:hypothetical protein
MPRDEGGENDEGKNDHHGHDYGARCARARHVAILRLKAGMRGWHKVNLVDSWSTREKH